MRTAEETKDLINRENRFLQYCGIKITELTDKVCRCECDIRDDFLNVSGKVQGGLFFTMADGSSGCFSRYFHSVTATVDSTFQYYGNVNSGKVFCEAVPIQVGSRLSRFNCKVTDENGKLLAEGTFTHYKVGD